MVLRDSRSSAPRCCKYLSEDLIHITAPIPKERIRPLSTSTKVVFDEAVAVSGVLQGKDHEKGYGVSRY